MKKLVAVMVVLGGCFDAVDLSAVGQEVQSGPVVVINELTPGTSGKIELYNAGDATADLSNWVVDDIAGGYAPKNVGASVSLAPGAYLVINYSGINTASTDEVRLLDPAGTLRDAHGNYYAGTSLTGLCFGRQPDGGAWATASITCSLGATNGCAAGAACDDGNACTTGETTQASCACSGGTPVGDGTSCGDGYACQSGVCEQVVSIDAAVDAAPDAGPDASPDAAPDAGVVQEPTTAEIVALPRRDRVLLQGTIVTPDQVFAGEVLIEGDTITCVAPSCQLQQQTLDAAIVNTRGLIFPGLIDTHNHILFDIFDETDWSPTKLYTNHNQWTNETRYKAVVDAKQYLNGEGSPSTLGCEMNKYGELKGLVAGTTSIQGSANPADKQCYAGLARTIDQAPNGLATDKVQTATIFPSTSAADGVCTNQSSGRTDAYVIHVAEGVDASALNEFYKLFTITTTDGCLYSPKTTIVHGTALGDAELSSVAASGMSLVWSPRSNVFLYGGGQDLSKTANIPLAMQKGINIALAPDWSMGGSQNLLDELRFADQVDNTVWGNVLTPKQLVAMVTINAARALGLGQVLGSIEVGKKADLLVIGGDPAAPYDSLLAATPASVRLVMVGGVALYGDAQLAPLGPPSPGCETLDVCSGSKFVCVAQSGGTATNKLGQTFAEIRANLDGGLRAYDDMNLSAYDFSPVTPLVRCQ